MASRQELPEIHRALVLTSIAHGPEIKHVPTPQPGAGSAVVRIEAANILSYSKFIYNGARNYLFPMPLVIGTSALGRIAALGPDSVQLKPKELVFIDCFIRGRDNPEAAFLFGIHEGHTEGSKILMRGEWRDSTYAEYAKVPLENCYLLDESLLQDKFGYGVDELQDISRLMVPYGGLADIGLKPGETIIIAPATGSFGGAAVKVALAMGARVIAIGRNREKLNRLASKYDRVETVQISGDIKADLKALQVFGSIEAYLDISPPEAAGSTHFQSCILALGQSGRVSLMGGLKGDMTIPLRAIVTRDIQIKGKWMYTRQDVKNLIRLVETGVLRLGERKVRRFSLNNWEEGFATAARMAGEDSSAIIVP